VNREMAIAIALSLGLHGLLIGFPAGTADRAEPPGRHGGPVPLKVLGPRTGPAGPGSPRTPGGSPGPEATARVREPPPVATQDATARPPTLPGAAPRKGADRGGGSRPSRLLPPASSDPDEPAPGDPRGPPGAIAASQDSPGGTGEGSERLEGLPVAGPGGSGTAGTSRPEGSEGTGSEAGLLQEARIRYALHVRQVLSRSLASPVALRRHGPPPELAIRLRIREDGRVLDAVPDAPCEDETLCRRLREAALDLGDLPSPPGGAMEIRVPVRVQSPRSRGPADR